MTSFSGQQHVIFHVEQTSRVVRAFDEKAETREPIGVVAQHRPIGAAVIGDGELLDEFGEAGNGRAIAIAGLALEALHLEKAVVDRFPHLGGQGRAHRARIAARKLEAIAHRAGIFRREG